MPDKISVDGIDEMLQAAFRERGRVVRYTGPTVCQDAAP